MLKLQVTKHSERISTFIFTDSSRENVKMQCNAEPVSGLQLPVLTDHHGQQCEFREGVPRVGEEGVKLAAWEAQEA